MHLCVCVCVCACVCTHIHNDPPVHPYWTHRNMRFHAPPPPPSLSLPLPPSLPPFLTLTFSLSQENSQKAERTWAVWCMCSSFSSETISRVSSCTSSSLANILKSQCHVHLSHTHTHTNTHTHTHTHTRTHTHTIQCNSNLAMDVMVFIF